MSALVLSAFLASAANMLNLQNRMPVACNVGMDIMFASAQDTWSTLNALPCPNEIAVNDHGTNQMCYAT